MSAAPDPLRDEVFAYTLAHPGRGFLHQHAVDAHTAQTATADSKPIAVAFALIGLHLHLERGWDGRRVQREHVRLAARRRDWPRFPLPAARGAITVADVARVAPGPARARATEDWGASAWAAGTEAHAEVARILAEEPEP